MVVTCTLYPRLMHSLLNNRRPTRAGRTRGERALTRTAPRKRPKCAGSPGNNANRVGDVEAALVPHRFSRRGLQAPAVKSFTGQGGVFRSFGRGSQLCYFAACGRGNEREMSQYRSGARQRACKEARCRANDDAMAKESREKKFIQDPSIQNSTETYRLISQSRPKGACLGSCSFPVGPQGPQEHKGTPLGTLSAATGSISHSRRFMSVGVALVPG
jgi:hypothetical protein